MAVKIRVFIRWLCIFFLEVGLIILSTKRFGATLTFYLVVGPALAGLVIQSIRWFLLKPMRDEASRLFKKIPFKRGHEEVMTNSPVYRAWSSLWLVTFADYWLATSLFLVPGFYCHIAAFLLILPVPRSLAYFVITGRWKDSSVLESKNSLTRLPGHNGGSENSTVANTHLPSSSARQNKA